MQQDKPRLGELLVQAEVLSQDRLEQALSLQQELGSRLGTVLIQKGFVTEPQLIQALSKQLSIPWVSLWHLDISEQLLDMIPEEIVLEHGVLPIYIRTLRDGDKALYVAMDNPADQDLLEEIGETCGLTVKPMIAGPSEIASAILSYYGTAWRGAPVQPPAEARISSVPPPPGTGTDDVPEASPPTSVTEAASAAVEEGEDSILLEEVVEDEQPGTDEETEVEEPSGPEGEMVEVTAPGQEGEPEEPGGEAGEVPDMFAPQAEEAPRRKKRFKRGPINLTFLDGTSIAFAGREKEKQRARQSRDDVETRIDGLGMSGGADENLALAVRGILKTLLRRGLLTESELEDLLKGE